MKFLQPFTTVALQLNVIEKTDNRNYTVDIYNWNKIPMLVCDEIGK